MLNSVEIQNFVKFYIRDLQLIIIGCCFNIYYFNFFVYLNVFFDVIKEIQIKFIVKQGSKGRM